jgi:hypothetical protein
MLVQYHGLVALGPDSVAANAYLSDARVLPCLVRSAAYALAAVVFGVMLVRVLWICSVVGPAHGCGVDLPVVGGLGLLVARRCYAGGRAPRRRSDLDPRDLHGSSCSWRRH